MGDESSGPLPLIGTYTFQGIGEQWMVTAYPDMEVLRPMLAYFACRGIGAKTILDCGGKDLEVSKYMQKWAEITVLDRDIKVREKALANGAVDFVHGDVRNIGTALFGRRFDAVLLMEILEHLDDEREAARVVDQCAAIGKIVVITTPCERDWAVRRAPFANPDHRIYWTDAVFAEMTRRAGCGIVLIDRVRLAGIRVRLGL